MQAAGNRRCTLTKKNVNTYVNERAMQTVTKQSVPWEFGFRTRKTQIHK